MGFGERFEEVRRRAVSRWQQVVSSRPRILVGAATCGLAAGAEQVIQAFERALAEHAIDAALTRVGCLGPCHVEVLVEIAKPGCPGILYGGVTPERAMRLVEDYLAGDNPHPDLALATIGEGSVDGVPRFEELPMLKGQVRIALRNCGLIDPEEIDQYIANDGFLALEKALKMKPEVIIEEVQRSGLRGRGGAGFPTGFKWQLCRGARGSPKYVVCNGDEGDPAPSWTAPFWRVTPFPCWRGW